MNRNILLIDDEPEFRKLLAKLIRLEGLNVFEANDGKEGLELFGKEEFQLVITDVRLPDIKGLDLIGQFKNFSADVEIIVITAFGTIEDGVEAIKKGAFDYLVKGDEENRIINTILKALERCALKEKISLLESKSDAPSSFSKILGNSQLLLQAKQFAEKVAPTDTPVLLTGETGTGKEIFAHAIHNSSNRADKPFVPVNCSAFGKDLLEAEMFGYKAGAFTGAIKNKKGLFEEAHTGTLFLDEIGELDLNLQAKLLRAIESNQFIKQGDTKTTTVDIRLIAATNRDLEQEIKEGRFRADLFFRLNVMHIKLPALRERVEDIRDLIDLFVAQFSRKLNKKITTITENFYSALVTYPLPGNIRELKNLVERCVILADDQTINATLLPKEILIASDTNKTEPISLERLEKEHILKVLARHSGNKTRSAEELGISTVTLYRKLEQYGLH